MARSQDGTAPGLVFQPVNDAQHSLDARIVTRIRDLIETGQLRPGDRLPPERELAVQLKVSRTVLREALHTLAAFGLVELQHGRGIFVTAGSAHATAHRLSLAMMSGGAVARLRDLFEIRRILEGAAAEWATERASAEQIANLRAILVECSATREAEPVTIALAGVLDARFHAMLAASTRNRTLMLLMATLVDELGVSRGRSLTIPGRASRSLLQHEAKGQSSWRHARAARALCVRSRSAISSGAFTVSSHAGGSSLEQIPARLLLWLRHFVCGTLACLRRILTERLPGVAAPQARQVADRFHLLRVLKRHARLVERVVPERIRLRTA